MSPAAQLSILLTLKDLASGPLSRFGEVMQQTSTKLIAAGEAARITGRAMMDMMRGPVTAFAEAEDAATRLKTVMMDAAGQVPPTFQAVSDLATELGNKLPGTTKDFQNMMSTLKEMGVTDQAILDGLGKSAAYLGVALKMPYEEAARFAARLSEAAGVAEKDMLSFLDVIARTRNLGVQTTEMEYAFARSAGKLKELGLQGMQTSRDLAPLYALLIRTGLSGETVGTGFAAVLTGMQKLAYGGGKAVEEARAALAEYGIALDVIDHRTGTLKGPRQLVAELEKLRDLPAQIRFDVLQKVFGGGQDAQMVATMIEKGLAGYQQIADQMAAQANLNAKVEAQLTTLKNVWDAASGTFENVLAKFAGLIAPELKRALAAFNGFSEWLFEVLERYPLLGKIVGMTLAFGGALIFAGGTAAMLAGMTMKAVGALATMAKWLGINRALAAGGTFARIAGEIATSGAPLKALGWHIGQIALQAKSAALAVGGTLKGALLGAGKAVLWLGRAVLLNPIGLALSTAALLVYKFWGPIKGFFQGLWDGLSQGFGMIADDIRRAFEPAMPLLRPLIDALGWLGDKIKSVIGWLGDLIKPMDDAGGAAKSLGEKVGLYIAAMVKTVLSLPGKLIALPSEMLKIGQQIVEGLIDGIKSKLSAAKDAVMNLGATVRDGLKNLLGIRSPSRVFAELGGFLGDGLSHGMRASLGEVQKAAAAMAGAATMALAPPALAAPVMQAAPDAARILRQAVEPVALPQPADALRTIRQAVEPVTLPQPADALRTIRQAVEPVTLPSIQPAALATVEPPRGALKAGAAPGAPMQITYAPQITVNGAASPEAARAQVTQAEQLSFAEFERLMRRHDAERRRVGWEGTT
jgi:TP901 family phage tail tape measure protein